MATSPTIRGRRRAGAWTNAPEAPTFEAEEPAPTVGGFVGADGFVYETKEQADKVAATMLAEAAAAQEAAARAAAELEAAQAAQAAEEALAAQATPVEPDATWVAAELDAEPATADAPEPVQPSSRSRTGGGGPGGRAAPARRGLG